MSEEALASKQLCSDLDLVFRAYREATVGSPITQWETAKQGIANVSNAFSQVSFPTPTLLLDTTKSLVAKDMRVEDWWKEL